MPKLATKLSFSFLIVLLFLANYSFSVETSEQPYATAASETESKTLSPESLPVLPNPDSPSTEAEAETLAPTYLSVSPSTDIPDVETKSSEILADQENTSTLSKADEPFLQSKSEENLPQELASSPSLNVPTTPEITNKGDENVSTTSLSPSNADSSVLDTRDMDYNFSQENTSVSLSKAADPPAVETKETSEDLFQENTSLPPSPSVDAPAAVETRKDSVLQENSSSPDESKGNENLPEEIASVPYSYSPDIRAPAPAFAEILPPLDATDGGSFAQENQSPVSVYAPAPETKGEEETTQYNYPLATPPNTESQTPENVPELNDYSSLPKHAAPAPSEAVSYPESTPTIEMTHPNSNDEVFGSAPASQNTILPFNYKAEDELVEPYYEEEDSGNGVNGAVAGVLVGACIIGVGSFIYQKRKNDNIRAQYTSLAKKGGV